MKRGRLGVYGGMYTSLKIKFVCASLTDHSIQNMNYVVSPFNLTFFSSLSLYFFKCSSYLLSKILGALFMKVLLECSLLLSSFTC